MVKKSISLLLLVFVVICTLFNLPQVAQGRDLSIPLDPVYWEGTGIISKNTSMEKNGIKALLWIPREKGHFLKTKKVPINWSYYNQIEMEIYSKKKTGSWINILVADHNNHLSSSFLEVDWTGWKTIQLSFNQLFASFSSQDMDWKNIAYMAFESHTSALLNIDETELSLSKILLTQISKQDTQPRILNVFQNTNSYLFPEEVISAWKKAKEESGDFLQL